MNIDSCYQLGYVTKAHGLKGGLTIFLDVDFPEEYENMESVFVEMNQKLVPFFIEKIQVMGEKAIIHFEDVEDIAAAEELKGCKLYLPLDNLPELGEGQFYYHQIIGYLVYNGEVVVGAIKNVYTFPNQDLLAVEKDNKEVLIPVNDAIIEAVNHQEKTMVVKLPDGLVDIYLEE